MLKLYYLTDNTKTLVPNFTFPNGYSVKNGTDGFPLLSAGNIFGGQKLLIPLISFT